MLRGLVAQWITRLPTEQKIPGSSPGVLGIVIFLTVQGVINGTSML